MLVKWESDHNVHKDLSFYTSVFIIALLYVSNMLRYWLVLLMTFDIVNIASAMPFPKNLSQLSIYAQSLSPLYLVIRAVL